MTNGPNQRIDPTVPSPSIHLHEKSGRGSAARSKKDPSTAINPPPSDGYSPEPPSLLPPFLELPPFGEDGGGSSFSPGVGNLIYATHTEWLAGTFENDTLYQVSVPSGLWLVTAGVQGTGGQGSLYLRGESDPVGYYPGAIVDGDITGDLGPSGGNAAGLFVMITPGILYLDGFAASAFTINAGLFVAVRLGSL